MKVTIIVIGDELLIGQVVDTNSGMIARMIEPAGWSVDSVLTVHDSAEAITHAIHEAMSRTDIVLTTGGLGPTKDDITKQVMCDYFGGSMIRDEAVLANIHTVFEKRGIKMNALTEAQSMVPSSCRVIQNRLGTAPIMWFERDGKVLVSMPGVPFETEGMFRTEVFPQLLAKYQSHTSIGHRTIVVAGLTESAVAMQLDEWERQMPPYTHLAYLPKPGIIRLRIDGTLDDETRLNATLDRLKNELIERFKDNILATDDLLPEEALIERLRRTGLTVASAESCTGGNIARRITAIAGCSDVYRGSVVSYANDVKTGLLGVDEATIAEHGVVSEPVVRQMAVGAMNALGTDCAVATSGIAGPSGATPGKPVGTVCIAAAVGERVVAATYRFPGSRDRVIDRASTTAITMLTMML